VIVQECERLICCCKIFYASLVVVLDCESFFLIFLGDQHFVTTTTKRPLDSTFISKLVYTMIVYLREFRVKTRKYVAIGYWIDCLVKIRKSNSCSRVDGAAQPIGNT
jgi:hypothetical protein